MKKERLAPFLYERRNEDEWSVYRNHYSSTSCLLRNGLYKKSGKAFFFKLSNGTITLSICQTTDIFKR